VLPCIHVNLAESGFFALENQGFPDTDARTGFYMLLNVAVLVTPVFEQILA
jgi:hypothetical protein